MLVVRPRGAALTAPTCAAGMVHLLDERGNRCSGRTRLVQKHIDIVESSQLMWPTSDPAISPLSSENPPLAKLLVTVDEFRSGDGRSIRRVC